TKFTEIGYVGRDVESRVRDLVDTSIRMEKAEKAEGLKDKAESLANERIVSILVPSASRKNTGRTPLEMLFNQQQDSAEREERVDQDVAARREEMRVKLANGELEDRQIEIEVED